MALGRRHLSPYGSYKSVHDFTQPQRMTSVPPVAGGFNREVINELADLGEAMGADPGAWRTDSP